MTNPRVGAPQRKTDKQGSQTWPKAERDGCTVRAWQLYARISYREGAWPMCLCLCPTGLAAPGRSGGQSVTTWLARMQHEVREVVAFCRQVVVLEETVGNRVEKQLPLYCASQKKQACFAHIRRSVSVVKCKAIDKFDKFAQKIPLK